METQKHSVIVIGGSVGGLRSAWLLSKKSEYDVTLLSKKKSFDHNTSLYRNKNGRSKRHVSIPLDKVFGTRRHRIDLVRAEASLVDPITRTVRTTKGIKYPYDSLIIALEGESRMPHGIDSSITHNAYSSGDMNELRRQLIGEFEAGQPEGNYVVIGGGQTGVEIVYELKMHMDSLAKRYNRRSDKYRILIVERSDNLVPRASSNISSRLSRRLNRHGIEVLLEQEVSKVRKGSLIFSDNSSIQTNTVILAAGQRANHFFADNNDVFLLGQGGFVRVNSLQEAEGYNNIYVIGNSKESDYELNTSGKIYDAEYVCDVLEAKRTGHELRDYDPPAFMTSLHLGKMWGVYETIDRAYFGRKAWILKRWLDRGHFSTLLPIRLWFVAWVFGTRHDEIY